MHQEPYQDACHRHQNRVVVHTLQAYGREEGDELPRGSWLVPSTHPVVLPTEGHTEAGGAKPGYHGAEWRVRHRCSWQRNQSLWRGECGAPKSSPGSRRVTTRSNRFLSAVTRFSTWFSNCEGGSTLVARWAHHWGTPGPTYPPCLDAHTCARRRSSISEVGWDQSRNISGTSVMVISKTRSRLTERSKQVAHTLSCRLSTKFLSRRSAACWI